MDLISNGVVPLKKSLKTNNTFNTCCNTTLYVQIMYAVVQTTCTCSEWCYITRNPEHKFLMMYI